MKSLKIFILAPLLGACSTFDWFAPPYDAELDKSVMESHKAVSEITACIDMGLCADVASFEQREQIYTKAVAGLKTARLRAETWEPPRRSATGAEAKTLLIEMIDGCQAQLMELGERHRKNGVPQNAGFTQPVDTACDQALRAVQALKQG